MIVDAPDIGPTQPPKLGEQFAREKAAGEKNDMKMRPAIRVKLHLHRVGRIDAVTPPLPLDAVAQAMKHPPQKSSSGMQNVRPDGPRIDC